MRHDEQNELQEGGHAASFFGFMHLPRILGITLLLSGSAWAQVGGEASDLEAGLVAKWDWVMPLDIGGLLKLQNPTQEISLDDFAITLAFRVEAPPEAGHDHQILALMNEGQGSLLNWNLGTTGLGITIAGHGLAHLVPVRPIVPGPWLHMVLNVKRDSKQALSGIWLNGIEVNSWREPSGPLMLSKALFEIGRRGLGGQIANLRLYNRALTRPEILELAAMAPMAGLKTKLEPFTGSMKLMTEEIVVVVGGTEAVAMMEEGTMEALLLTQFPGSRVKLRSLAWEADTVFRQDRPMNFGGLKQQLVRSGATAAMLMFGRQECLERGEAGLAEFREALEKLVTLCAEVTPRLVLLEPPAFEGELEQHNATLKKYAAVMEEVAKSHGALFAAQDGKLKPGSTRDGLTLTSKGAAQLGMRVAGLWNGDLKSPPRGGDLQSPDTRLKALIGEKNRLWHRYWRPANWAFLHGDRTAQPSSRDHTDPTQRWFPGEVEQFKPLIEAKENELWKLANELGGKLP